MKAFNKILWILLLIVSAQGWGETSTCTTAASVGLGRWTSGNVQYPYQVYAPANLVSGRCYPLVINLHGAGATNPVSMVPAQYFLNVGQKVTAHFILIPTMSNGWDAAKVKALIDHIVQTNPVDKNRIYGSGQSMGGFGTGALANAYPDLLAAAVAVAGIVWPIDQAAQQTALYAPKIAKIPYWGFHGALDGTVPVQSHRNFITALRANGGTPKYTEFPDGKHNIWNPSGQNYVYIQSVGVAEWMFSQQRNGGVQPTPSPTPAAGFNFALINAVTDQVIASHSNLALTPIIDPAALGVTQFNIAVVPRTTGVASVSVTLDGVTRTENVAPYSAAGDSNGDYAGMTLSPGSHTINAKAYSGTNATNVLLDQATLIFQVANPSTPSPTPSVVSGRRIAIDSDGNYHDRDDISAAAMTLAILAKAGLAQQVVHYSHSDHLWETSDQRENQMEDSVLGTMSRYGGYGNAFVYNAKRQTQAAVDHLRSEMQKSTAASPLYVIAAGPMQVVGLALEGVSSNARANVYIISHSTWNNEHASLYHGGYHFNQLNANRISILNQNGGMSTPYQDWYFLRDSTDSKMRWLWDRGQVAAKTEFDVSDAGMAYYLAFNDQNVTVSKVRGLLGKPDAPTPSPTPTSSPVASPSPTPPVVGSFYNFPQREWYLLQGVDTIGGVPDAEIARADIDGLSVRVAWATVHPNVGSYNFTSIRQELARVKRLGKRMQLRIMSGPSAPAWLKDRGVRYLGTIPHPQDDKVLDYWQELHTELMKEFASERTIVVVHASGIAPESAEWLYNAHTTLYSEPDFDGAKMTSNWIRAISIQARAFPNAIISANLGDHDRDWVKVTIGELKRIMPLQIAFQINSLSAKLPTTWLGFQNIQNAGAEGFHSGFQMLCGSNVADRFGGTWDAMITKLQTTKAQWLEIYRADVNLAKPRSY